MEIKEKASDGVWSLCPVFVTAPRKSVSPAEAGGTVPDYRRVHLGPAFVKLLRALKGTKRPSGFNSS